MGRHFCKFCCESHPLPSMPAQGGDDNKVDMRGVPASSFALQDTKPESLNRSGFKRIEGMRVADSDYSDTHAVSKLTLRIPKQGLLEGGFWSWVFAAEVVGHGWGTKGNEVAAPGAKVLKGRVLIKVYKEQASFKRAQVFARFHRELTALGTLGELPGIVTCHGFGFTSDSWPFLVLDHVGVPLSAVLETNPASLVEKHVASQLLGTLEAVHTMGLAHNDLHADNILLQEGAAGVMNLVIVDWNSVEPCTLFAGETAGDFAVQQDEEPHNPAEAETVAVIRDCQAAGKVLLLCVDRNLHRQIFDNWEFLGTVANFANAAMVVKAADSLKAPWKEAIPPLLAPRALDPIVEGGVTYPIVNTARKIAAFFGKQMSKSKWQK